ncbi:MAG: hypothetical protein EOO09_11595 [Chitinophagaceae bacterium]|nr:MAG: hypothetical protein EOO09_11595 [Chitinophagaceae bacterium]
MFNRLDKYLLTHRPLLWNTKAITVVAVAILVHLLFFAAGIGSLDTTRLGEYSHYYYEGSGVYTMTFLCSAGILIAWLVFYLRNNALKEFYILDKYYLARQFLIVLLVIFTSIGFFHSYKHGIETRARFFTSRSQLVHEDNILNLSKRFLPNEKTKYFKLNRCSIPDSMHVSFNEDMNYYDTSLSSYNYQENARIRAVLKDPDAFTYDNFCVFEGSIEGADSQWLARGQRWLDQGRRDSVRYVLTELQSIAGRYNVKQRLHVDSLVAWVFRDSAHTVTRTLSFIDPDDYITDYVTQARFPAGSDYIMLTNLESAIDFVDRAYTRPFSSEEIEFLCVLLYVALAISVLLFAYRMFSKRVFLMAVIGTIIWMIIIFGSLAGYRSEEFALVLLVGICTLSGFLGSRRGIGKTLRGILLCWHLWLVPFMVLFLVQLVKQYYQGLNRYIAGSIREYTDAQMAQMHPFSYWVDNHEQLIIYYGLIPAILYILFVFTRLARHWQGSPEE